MTEIYKISYMANKLAEELKLCERIFTHETHAIKITDQHNDWLTVYARNRATKEKELECSFRKYRKGKKYGVDGFAYLFRNTESLSILGAPK